ncbi:MAG: class I SAM-dependent methyltransferase [Desulfobacterales bacterium]|nr:class I SAM-dependent methyltransferase [Desulfobacterales bacterium]
MKDRKFPVSDYKSKDSRWNAYYSSFDIESYLRILEYDEATLFIDEHLGPLPKESFILDIGCGSGRHLVHLSNMGFTNLFGVDLSPHGIRNLTIRRPEIKAQVADATKLPFDDNTFEAILMVGVVYEIANVSLHDQVITEIRRVLRPGGRVVFINNSPYNFGERIFTITQTISAFVKSSQLKFFVWRYERKDVHTLFLRHGLRLVEEWPCSIRRGVFRFFYGIFVPKNVKENRKRRINNTNGQPYSLHEYYLVNKDRSLLTPLGNYVARISARVDPFLFANTICYLFKKKAPTFK